MIQGELVNLRGVEREDVVRITAWLNEPATMRGWGWSAAAVSRFEISQRVEGWLADEAVVGRPLALVIETLTGEAVGLVVLTPDRAEAHTVELSLLIGDPARWGEGLGSDALATVLDACFAGWNLHRVWLRVEVANDRAYQLYQHHGFIHEGTLREAAFLDGAYHDLAVFGLLAREWRQRSEVPSPEQGEIPGAIAP